LAPLDVAKQAGSPDDALLSGSPAAPKTCLTVSQIIGTAA
jgi:hypothetical protein